MVYVWQKMFLNEKAFLSTVSQTEALVYAHDFTPSQKIQRYQASLYMNRNDFMRLTGSVNDPNPCSFS